MSKIDLSKYVGKHMEVTLRDRSVVRAVLQRVSDRRYPFKLGSYAFTPTGKYFSAVDRSILDITKINAVRDAKRKSDPAVARNEGEKNEATVEISEERAIEALKKLGYDVSVLKRKLRIDWSKQSDFIVGFAINKGGGHVVFSKTDRKEVPLWCAPGGWVYSSSSWFRISAEDSPLKDYTGKPEDSLHMRPKE